MSSAASGSRASTPRSGSHGLSYSQFIHGLNGRRRVDRKVMADLAVRDAAAFGSWPRPPRPRCAA